MNVLMTGASGLIGQALDPFLAGHGHPVRRLRRTPSDTPDLLESETEGLLLESD